MEIQGDAEASDVGTGVARTGAVTAAEDIIEATAVDDHLRAGHCCGIATAIEGIDGVVAGVDIDGGPFGGGVVGLLAAAEDISDGIGCATVGVVGRGGGMCSFVYVHHYGVLRRAVGVVTAVDIAADGGVAEVGH